MCQDRTAEGLLALRQEEGSWARCSRRGHSSRAWIRDGGGRVCGLPPSFLFPLLCAANRLAYLLMQSDNRDNMDAEDHGDVGDQKQEDELEHEQQRDEEEDEAAEMGEDGQDAWNAHGEFPVCFVSVAIHTLMTLLSYPGFSVDDEASDW